MEIDEGQRLRMVDRLQELVGPEVTDTLMAYLPAGGWGAVPTKADVAEVRLEIGELRTETRTGFADVRMEFERELGGLRTETRTGFADVRMEFERELGGLRTETRTGFADVRLEIERELGGLRTEMHQGFSDLRHDIRLDRRSLFFGLIGVFSAYGAAIIAATRLR
jgi:hypothetical protein